MKRILAFLLVCLILCGCSAAPAGGNTSGKGSHDGETTQPTTVTVPNAEDYPEETGLAVKFEMGAEFEMVLDMYHAVLKVIPLNETGEKLLNSIEPTGSYRNAVEIILEEAIRQEVLTRGKVIKLAAYEVGDGAWTVADHCILTWPIENYQKNCGLNFACKLTPAGDCYDDSSYLDTFTSDCGDFINTVCYRKDRHEMTCMEYNDGSYSEIYYVTSEDFWGCTYYADGRFLFSHNTPLSNEYYTLLPDGLSWGYSEALDEAGNTTHYTSFSEDGSYVDYYYENGITISAVHITSDGIRQESTYYENGQPKLTICHDPNGSYWESENYETGISKRFYSRSSDGGTNEQHYYENGQLKLNIYGDPNGYYQESEYYDNGQLKLNIYNESNGYYQESEYYETGITKRFYSRNPDGTSTEQYYDENGNPVDAPTEP